jgi:hypothetical protein
LLLVFSNGKPYLNARSGHSIPYDTNLTQTIMFKELIAYDTLASAVVDAAAGAAAGETGC